MTVMSDITGKPLKHYAVDKNTNARYFMLAYENDTNKDECSVLNMDRLNSDLRSELTEIINSDECQHEIHPYVVLDRKFFYEYPKQTILQVLRTLRLIENKNSDDVLVQMPHDLQWSPKQIMDAIRQVNQEKLNTLKGKDRIIEEKDNELKNVKTIESKNAEDIADLKKQFALLQDNIGELINIVKESKKSKK